MADATRIQTCVQGMFRTDIVDVKSLWRKGRIIVEVMSVGLRVHNEVLFHSTVVSAGKSRHYSGYYLLLMIHVVKIEE